MSLFNLAKPTEQAAAVLASCIVNYTDHGLLARLRGACDAVAQAAAAYEVAATSGQTWSFPGSQTVGPASRDEMIAVYTQKLAKVGQPGRALYNRLRSATKLCPFCGQRVVKTLDHYLEKSSHPALAVAPQNLVPCCTDCNFSKRGHCATAPGEQLLHPYYDDLGAEPWLTAEVVQGTPPALRFRVEAPPSWSPVLTDRVKKHLAVLGLYELYSVHAGQELAQIRITLQRVHAAGGAEDTRKHLAHEAECRVEVNPNSWQSATYRALAADDWFCSDGIAQIR